MRKGSANVQKTIRRRLDAFLSGITELDIDLIRDYGRYYEKIRVSPPSVASEKSPPGWLWYYLPPRLERAALSWRERLDLRFGREGARVYIWIFENDILGSQLVCDFGDLLGFYENSFEPCPRARRGLKLPRPWDSGNGGGAPGIRWERRIERGYKYSGLDGLSAREMRRLEKTSLVAEAQIHGKPETSYGFIEDYVWVGTI